MGKKTRDIISLVFSVVITLSVSGQISPGDLAEPHAHLEGLSNCTKCHVLGEAVSNDKCLDCHTLLKSRVDQDKGYHSSSEVKGKQCIGCHSDHHGRNFDLVRFDTDQFDHTLTGYELEGSHKEQACDKCHKDEHIQNPEIRKKEFTYLGLDQACLTCHKDYHQQTLSNDCAKCHGFDKFKPAGRFNHSDTEFKLLGKHKDVACEKCHKKVIRNGLEFQQFAGLQFESCVNCHNDVHDNRFGPNCSECHTEESFHVIKGISNFDHSRTGYLLEGKHRFVECKSCHKGPYTEPLKHDLCKDCHEDYHENQFAEKGVAPDCATCHTVDGFTPSTYTIEDHNQSEFALKGAHLATPCFACHKKPDNEKWQFREIGMRCIDCHEDIHDPYLDKKYYPKATCTSCHRETRWSDIDFDHKKTEYVLEGEHANKTCRDCHFKKEEDGNIHQQFKELTAACLNCHKDEHYGQFAERGDMGCTACHDYNNWKASRFDHNKTNFSLEGAHQHVACKECHKPVEAEQTTYILYKIPSYRCEDCHK